jgi:Lon-like ATP-dependent protease
MRQVTKGLFSIPSLYSLKLSSSCCCSLFLPQCTRPPVTYSAPPRTHSKCRSFLQVLIQVRKFSRSKPFGSESEESGEKQNSIPLPPSLSILNAQQDLSFTSLPQDSIPSVVPFLYVKGKILPREVLQIQFHITSLQFAFYLRLVGQFVGLFYSLLGTDSSPRSLDDVLPFGVLAKIVGVEDNSFQMNTSPESDHIRRSVIVTAVTFDKIEAIELQNKNLFEKYVSIKPVKEDNTRNEEVDAYHHAVVNQWKLVWKLYSQLTNKDFNEMFATLRCAKDPIYASYVCALYVPKEYLPSSEDLTDKLLRIHSLRERLEFTLKQLQTLIRRAELINLIQRGTALTIDDAEKRFKLRARLTFIQKTLYKDATERKYRERLAKLNVPPKVLAIINEEITKLTSHDSMSPEVSITKTYLDWLTLLPWGVYTTDNLSLRNAETILESDHFGLSDVKERILQFIAVSLMKKSLQGKILCLVGPPGTGKTSIGRSIARALGRHFFRFSVGGLNDIAEVKGHRRTYIGAMPSKFIQALRKCGSSNPVILIDEIDKVSTSVRGDPVSALLEALDPEQNVNFLDHYLDVPYDLSKVLFICTANLKENIPYPLLDRMEIVTLSGYVLEEKQKIAENYLLPRITKECGLQKDDIQIDPDTLKELIQSYCREAGVRSLQKHLEKIWQKVTLMLVQRQVTKPVVITKDKLIDFVGTPKFNINCFYEQTPIGVAMGLAYNEVGGSMFYIETAVDRLKNKAELKTTGNMGNVMKESAMIAYTFAKTYLAKIHPTNTFFEKASLHLHVPFGHIFKEGPSAGCALVTSLLSLALQCPVKQHLAMTGEITLTGKVLPIGGVKEKTIAAKRSGVTELIFPQMNKKDFDELPEYVKRDLTVHFVTHYNDIFKIAFPHWIPPPKSKGKATDKGAMQPQSVATPPIAADTPNAQLTNQCLSHPRHQTHACFNCSRIFSAAPLPI